MLTFFTICLVLLAALTAYLLVSLSRRHRAEQRAEEARQRALDRQFPPKAFDASAIAPQVIRVRQDCAALARQRCRPSHSRVEFFLAARRWLRSLSYFRRSRDDHEPQKP
jgi:hypothetical protein